MNWNKFKDGNLFKDGKRWVISGKYMQQNKSQTLVIHWGLFNPFYA